MDKIRVESNPSEERLKGLDTKSWPTWTCDVSEFDWHYDQNEACYFLEGEVTVETSQEKVDIKKGDLVFFPKDLDCKWCIIKPVRKVYKLG
ncbi:cupin domain-containing protein [Candidatus Omnitrophota bacterium]